MARQVLCVVVVFAALSLVAAQWKPDKGASGIPRIHVVIGNEGEWLLNPTSTDSTANTSSGFTGASALSSRDRRKQKPLSPYPWDIDIDKTKEESEGVTYVKRKAAHTSSRDDSNPSGDALVVATADGRVIQSGSKGEVLSLSAMSRATRSSHQQEVETITASQEQTTDTSQHYRKRRRHETVISNDSSPHLTESGFTPSASAFSAITKRKSNHSPSVGAPSSAKDRERHSPVVQGVLSLVPRPKSLPLSTKSSGLQEFQPSDATRKTESGKKTDAGYPTVSREENETTSNVSIPYVSSIPRQPSTLRDRPPLHEAADAAGLMKPNVGQESATTLLPARLAHSAVPAAVGSDTSHQRSPDVPSALQATPTALEGLHSGRDEQAPQTAAYSLVAVSEDNLPLQAAEPPVDKPPSPADT